MSDQQLLQEYSQRQSEAAFTELVRRHVDLVYSAALRMVRDLHAAQDITQNTFSALAQNAGQLKNHPVLAGWLHRTAQNLAVKAIRSETRRRDREQAATDMNATAPDPLWDDLAPHLDTALQELAPADRDAILLRYFQRQSARTMAGTLGITEEAAQKRLNRAVDRLRQCLSKRGLNVGAASLAALIASNSVHAAPAGLALAVSGAALAGVTLSTVTQTILMTTFQKAAVAAALAAAVGTGVYQSLQASSLREQLQTLESEQSAANDQLQLLRGEIEGIAALRAENDRLNSNNAELVKLRGDFTTLRRQHEELLKQIPKQTIPRSPQQAQIVHDGAWIQQILDGPPHAQGMAAGELRGKFLRGKTEEVNSAEIALREGLRKLKLNDTLEKSPTAFAEFQSAYIQSALGIEDPSKVQQIRDLIQRTYEQVVAQGLDIPSKPTNNDTTDWVQRRHQLDRQATTQLKQLLTEEEQAHFDRAFLGVMGVDLGGIDVDKSNYPKGFLGE